MTDEKENYELEYLKIKKYHQQAFLLGLLQVSINVIETCRRNPKAALDKEPFPFLPTYLYRIPVTEVRPGMPLYVQDSRGDGKNFEESVRFLDFVGSVTTNSNVDFVVMFVCGALKKFHKTQNVFTCCNPLYFPRINFIG